MHDYIGERRCVILARHDMLNSCADLLDRRMGSHHRYIYGILYIYIYGSHPIVGLPISISAKRRKISHRVAWASWTVMGSWSLICPALQKSVVNSPKSIGDILCQFFFSQRSRSYDMPDVRRPQSTRPCSWVESRRIGYLCELYIKLELSVPCVLVIVIVLQAFSIFMNKLINKSI